MALFGHVPRYLGIFHFISSDPGALCAGKRRRGITYTSNTAEYLGDYRLFVQANVWEAEKRMNSKLNGQT